MGKYSPQFYIYPFGSSRQWVSLTLYFWMHVLMIGSSVVIANLQSTLFVKETKQLAFHYWKGVTFCAFQARGTLLYFNLYSAVVSTF